MSLLGGMLGVIFLPEQWKTNVNDNRSPNQEQSTKYNFVSIGKDVTVGNVSIRNTHVVYVDKRNVDFSHNSRSI